MSFTCPAAFKAALLQGTVPLRLAIRIARRDGAVFGFCTGSLATTLPSLTVGNIAIPSQLYDHRWALTVSNWQETADLSPNTMEMSLNMGAGGVTEESVRRLLWTSARFSFLIFHRENLAWQILRGRGTLGGARIEGGRVTFKLRSLSQILQQDVIELTSPMNRANWGDPEMAWANLDGQSADGHPLRVSGPVSNVTSARRSFRLAAAAGQPAQRMEQGRIEWLSGANAGILSEVMSCDGAGNIVLWHPTPYPIGAGDTARATIGVPLTIEQWVTVFGDGRRFNGEPHLTTAEEAHEIDDDTTVNGNPDN